MPGERFSRLYAQTREFKQESERARHRIAALFRETIFTDHTERLAVYISREVGVPILGGGRYSSQWNQFICECPTLDFLDTITLVYRYLFWHVGEEVAHWWRGVIKQIFTDEHLAYEIDDVGGVHPAIDQEFQRNMVSAVAVLQSQRYQNISQLIETASTHLGTDPPNYKHAWRAMLSAVEGLFGIMFPYTRLTTGEIERRLVPIVHQTYEADALAQRAARAMLSGFKEWIEASQIYRHEPGVADVQDPPADIAVLAISYGASLLRWLAGLDKNRQKGQTGINR